MHTYIIFMSKSVHQSPGVKSHYIYFSWQWPYKEKSDDFLRAQSLCRVVHSEAVDECICFTRKFQHGGDWERSRPQGPKNVHNFLITVRPLSWACGHGTEMLLILKKQFSTWLLPDIFQYDSPKKWPTILYAVNLWLKPSVYHVYVSATLGLAH